MIDKQRRRSGWLTGYLILMFIGNIATGLYYLLAGPMVRQYVPTLSESTTVILGILGLANVVFTYGIWNWKKWGIFGIAASSAVMFGVNLIAVGVGAALFGFVGLAILAALVYPVWAQFDQIEIGEVQPLVSAKSEARSQFCTQCGSRNGVTDQFCGECGARLV